MPTIYLVRHGRAAAGFDSHRDPGLDELGRAQAQAVAAALAAELPSPLPILSSPLARARETAAPLAALWEADVAIEPRIAEIPSPVEDLRERGVWLRAAMAASWMDLPPRQRRWRDEVVEWAGGVEQDVVAFCHFIPINVLVAAATDAEALIVFRPDNGSVTRIDADGERLVLVERGQEAATRVN